MGSGFKIWAVHLRPNQTKSKYPFPPFSGYSAPELTESKLNCNFLLKLSNVAEIQEMPSSTKIIPDYNRAP